MNVLIIEDEKPAAEKLITAIQRANTAITVAGITDSIKKSVEWLKTNPAPSIIFMDIELADGLSFGIFDEVNITSPVIFCTAFDEYWQEAFEHNSIDYLLKPVKQEKLEAALSKYEKLKQHFTRNFHQFVSTQQAGIPNTIKKRFLVKRGSDYVSVRSEDIAYFYATHKLVCMVDLQNQKFILDQSLAEIESQLDPQQFYRVNRKYLVNQDAIRKIKTYPKSKLQLELEPLTSEEIIISQDNTAAFKEWMDK